MTYDVQPPCNFKALPWRTVDIDL